MERGWQEFWDRIAHKDDLNSKTILNAKNVCVESRGSQPAPTAMTQPSKACTKPVEHPEDPEVAPRG